MRAHEQIPPEETEIEDLLSRFKPHPTARFEQKMKSTPWQQAMPITLSRRVISSRVIWGLALLLVILLVSAVTLIPSVRAIARQIFRTFLSAPSNQIQVQVTLSHPGDLFNFTDPSNFSLGIAEAKQKAGFEVKQILPVPDGYELMGARFDPKYNSVILLYQDPDHYLTLLLSQRPLNNSEDVFSIGQDAQVKLVHIGELQGEFVQGGWQATSTQPVNGTHPPGSVVNISAVWDNNLPQSTLRWREGDFAYELRSNGYGGPAQSELIKWANELK